MSESEEKMETNTFLCEDAAVSAFYFYWTIYHAPYLLYSQGNTLRFANHCILLFTVYTLFQLFFFRNGVG